MTAIASSGQSPFSTLDEEEGAQPWMDVSSFHSLDTSSFEDLGAGEMVFNNSSAAAPSPSIVSTGSWNIVAFPGQHPQIQQSQSPTRRSLGSLATPSPVLSQHMADLSGTPFSTSQVFGGMASADINGGHDSYGFNFEAALRELPFSLSHQQSILDQAVIGSQGDPNLFANGLFDPSEPLFPPLGYDLDLGPPICDPMDHGGFGTQLPEFSPTMQSAVTAQPWNPADPRHFDFNMVDHVSVPGSVRSLSKSVSPTPVAAQIHGGRSEGQVTVPDIRKKSSGVQKTRKKSKTPPRIKTPDRKLEDGVFTFCNQTVDTFGKTTFGEMEHQDRSSQKGRKGALSDETRASALNVRKQGACFCCHIRKVKCDEQRPCKNCVKLCTQVPDAACWKFSEFTTIIFPGFLFEHFQRSEMNQFVADNVASFKLNGVETPVTLTLSSGNLFATKLTVKAKLFTAKSPTSEVLQHYSTKIVRDGVELEAYRCAPIGFDNMESETGGSMHSELKRKVMAYMEGLSDEEGYALQLNDIVKSTTTVPMTVLQLAQRYAQQAPEADASIVRRMLGVLALQHVMARHLTLTPQSVAELQRVYPFRMTVAYVTARLLQRQIKAVVDECMKELVPMVFDDFLKRLKTKSRKEWAPCVAAFLVFCLLMETTEAAADTFAINQQEIDIRNHRRPKFMRAQALEANRHIESMPFKQFAYQFHQIYQTHSHDASAKSFNPLQDNARVDMWDLEPAAREFVRGLKEDLDGNFPCVSRVWHRTSSLQPAEGELDWLTFDPILLPNGEGEEHPYPRDVTIPYRGRLVAKFLLSFKHPKHLFTS